MIYYQVAVRYPDLYYHFVTDMTQSEEEVDSWVRGLQKHWDDVYVFFDSLPDDVKRQLNVVNQRIAGAMFNPAVARATKPNGLVPERLDIENIKTEDIPHRYEFRLPLSAVEVRAWLAMSARYQAGDFAWEHDKEDPRNRIRI